MTSPPPGSLRQVPVSVWPSRIVMLHAAPSAAPLHASTASGGGPGGCAGAHTSSVSPFGPLRQVPFTVWPLKLTLQASPSAKLLQASNASCGGLGGASTGSEGGVGVVATRALWLDGGQPSAAEATPQAQIANANGAWLRQSRNLFRIIVLAPLGRVFDSARGRGACRPSSQFYDPSCRECDSPVALC